MSKPIRKIFQSTKTYTHAQGFSAAFRQWRADSHCNLIHGYALEIKLVFEAELDERNWVQDFGGLKPIKAWLESQFDHTLLVAHDDPELEFITKELHARKLADVRILPAVGCEAFASYIFDHVHKLLPALRSVEVREHAGNSAVCTKAEDCPAVVRKD